MTQAGKIYVEKIILDLFRKAYKEFPKGKLIKTESPDFILKNNSNHSIGIELTELYSYKKRAKPYSFEQIVGLIRKKEKKINLYQKRNLNEIWLLISIDTIEAGIFNNWKTMIEKQQITSVFKRVFLFELYDKGIIELSK